MTTSKHSISQSSCVPALLLALTVVPTLSACGARHFERTAPAVLQGELLVRWYGEDKFEFVPSTARPFELTRARNVSVRPDRPFFTDGGSIPRPLWGLRHYSPWGYGPAFVLHDWLFVAHRCKWQIPGTYDLEEAARVMSEATKTLMEKQYVETDKQAMWLMYLAVTSDVALDLWNKPGCPEISATLRERGPISEWPIAFPTRRSGD